MIVLHNFAQICMWGAEGERCLQHKYDFNLKRKHRATYV